MTGQNEMHECRLGKDPCLVKVTLTRDFAPELMLVSGNLAKALNLKAGTRGHILRKLWAYAKEHSKVDDEDPAYVTADDELVQLLGEKRLDMSTLSRKMNAFLSCPAPVQLQHKLVLDGPSPCTALVVDMEVAWSLKPNMLQLPAFLERFDARVLLDEQDRRINGASLHGLVTLPRM
jgi:chromatin remodeling complex protein RSC6